MNPSGDQRAYSTGNDAESLFLNNGDTSSIMLESSNDQEPSIVDKFEELEAKEKSLKKRTLIIE
jgi:hypothetical protein